MYMRIESYYTGELMKTKINDVSSHSVQNINFSKNSQHAIYNT